ncbi:hypothetical protein [Salinivibrio kushneri]|uniref:HNH endonuclease n=1 Tax=Salinivibrio kushneri TaxID=1908198 RepID=A0AA47KNB9_9GAMM|nr:hypothetical protein [Salinivibrio kushneri]WBA10029.1 hypothetical protein N8M53_14545 [Salinivibrio kushneri]
MLVTRVAVIDATFFLSICMPASPPSSTPCALCQHPRPLTFHHLIPKTCHNNKWFTKRFSRPYMREHGIWVCRPCHAFIHRQFSEKHLGRTLHSLDLLLAEPVIQDYIHWARKQRG